MTAPPVLTPLADAERRLAALEQQVQADLFALRHPEKLWVPPKASPDGAHVHNVVIAGAGQAGLAVGGLLRREGVDNVLLIDRRPEGREGVWHDFARMPEIRSPKHYPGPDQGVPNLTYEAWHRAAFGDESWDAIDLVPLPQWNAYLVWIRKVLALPVRNETELTAIRPHAVGLELTVRTPAGDERLVCRRLVLATGHDGTGRWWMPPYLEALPAQLRAQAADPIDFGALKGKTVAVLGIGASAGDNAIAALEAGADAVHMFCRRDTIRRQQVYRWVMSAGFLRHCHELDDEWRWRFMTYVLETRMAMPPNTWAKVSSLPGFHLHTSANWRGARTEGGRVIADTEQGPFAADFVIACTGHDQDLTARPELAPFADRVQLWRDAYRPPADEANERLARYPYLDRNFGFMEKEPGAAPWLSRIHDFSFGPTLSFGPSGCSISTLRLTVEMLVAGITRQLLREDVEEHWRALQAHPDYIPF
ncbi:MAG: NAD(P)/FAD-dependent oxidoreductase [Alphaproteobacteria bacterium]|nr:NAD(P)/FAD-dependent oxidoreductase [Alphaproteobacteria bacterium]MCB9928346.1 NAD(P)/FAD-dependent oxidoreductase [Alphaproteobacteria bacterium]